jgi:glycosyltransferase involved in cell wall biosynthesis
MTEETAKIGSRVRLLNFLFLPDAKIGWYPFAISAGRKIIEDFKPQVVFATAPPWTALLIGSSLAKRFHLPFVADFRDPWPLGFQPPPFYQRPFLKKMLKSVFARARLVLAVNKGTKMVLERFLFSSLRCLELNTQNQEPKTIFRIELLENGFDPDEYREAKVKVEETANLEAENGAGFRIVYVGNLFENQKEIEGFIAALSSIPDVWFYLAGSADRKSQQRLEAQPRVKLLGKVPHQQAIAVMKGADALLYIAKPNQPVGLKLYEYLGACKPIIIWGKGADEARELVKEFESGMACENGEELRWFIREVRENPSRFTRGDRSRLNRRFQAQWLARRLSSLL